MRLRNVVILAAVAWTGVITGLHLTLNAKPKDDDKFRVGFLPVTCHLTCPVTDFINKQVTGDGLFRPVRFNGWPELKEAFLSRNTQATFILAPMAMALREEGIPLKIVYLGHRDGTAMMVHKDSDIRTIDDLRGKKVAVPNRFSNQRLLLFKALRDRGMRFEDVKLIEMAPPDMPAALYSKSVDAISSGEPFMGQTELEGYGRVLYLTKDIWPEFISCVLAVREDVIAKDRQKVAALIEGIARSGKWIDHTLPDLDSRMQTADFVSRNYYNQDPRLLAFVLSKPPDRVKYTNLALKRKDFAEIEELAVAAGVLKGKVHFDDYCDASFVTDDANIKPYAFTYGKSKAELPDPAKLNPGSLTR
jgi:NitT/TauT family transport system substrate-binding protein